MAEKTLTDITRNWAKSVLIGDALNRTAAKIGATAVGRARAYVSGRVLSRRSGNLLESIRFQVDNTQNGVAAVILAGGGRNNVQYAAIHEYGGVIRPKTAGGWLKFKIGEQWIQTRMVRMPKRPYVQPAVNDVMPLVPKLLAKEIDKALGVSSGV